MRVLRQSSLSRYSSSHCAICALFVMRALLASTRRVHQYLRRLRKHSRNRPVLRTGLPNTIQMHKCVVMAPSLTSHIVSEMVLPSSKRYMTYFSCVPAKLSLLCSLHGIASANHVSGDSFRLNRVAVHLKKDSCTL